MPSTQSFTSSVASQMLSAINKLQIDAANPAVSVAQLQQDVVAYYDVQEGQRGYASLAAAVAGESDYNGTVAVQNIENFYGDSSFGRSEVKVAVDLAEQDWANITQNGTISVATGQMIFVPTIGDDDFEHAEVFQDLKIPLSYWSGSLFADDNINWMGSIASAAELQGVGSQAGQFPQLTAAQTCYAFADLTAAALESDLQTLPGMTYISERLGDDIIAAEALPSVAAACVSAAGGGLSSLGQEMAV